MATETQSEPANGTIPKSRSKTSDPPKVGESVGEILERVQSAPMVPEQPLSSAEQAEKRRRVDHWLAVCGGRTSRYVGCTLDNYECRTDAQREVVAAIREYVVDLAGRRDRGENLVFLGPVGTGKDHLAMAVMRLAVSRLGHSLEAVFGADWFGDVRDAMDADNAPSERQLVRRLSQPDWLLISDPLPTKVAGRGVRAGEEESACALTPHQASMLLRVVNARATHRRPTIITINVASGREAESRMGAATVDRLRGGAWTVVCDWKSYRKPIREVGGFSKGGSPRPGR